MNRRDAMQAAAAGITAAIGGTVQAIELPADRKPVCFVVRYPGPIDQETRMQIDHCVVQAFGGTEWAFVPVIILPNGADFRLETYPPEQ
jgi:hypothetical protein